MNIRKTLIAMENNAYVGGESTIEETLAEIKEHIIKVLIDNVLKSETDKLKAVLALFEVTSTKRG